jgi:carbonic anhydrase
LDLKFFHQLSFTKMRFQFAIAIFLLFAVICYQVSSSAFPNPGRRLKRGAGETQQGHDWGYAGELGPETWCSRYQACCGLLQSPINLVGDNTTHVRFAPLALHGYGLPKTVILKNNGHTVAVSLKNPELAPTISGGHLGGTYKLDAIHFHWGETNTDGSEHTRDGEGFPLEIHLVHFNTLYGNSTAAQAHADGLAVLGVFHTVHSTNNTNLQPIVNGLRRIPYVDQTAEVQNVDLRKLLPNDLSKFFRYSGSLTTPPCSEVVTWTVFDDTRGVSEAQLREFRGDLHSEHEPTTAESDPNEEAAAHNVAAAEHNEAAAEEDDVISNNHRNVQDGHDRLVQHNVDRWRLRHRNFGTSFLRSGRRLRHHG